MINYSLKFLYSRIKKPTLSKQQTQSKVCQEIFISKIGSHQNLSSKIVFEGGLIVDALSKGKRGYTKDIDFDFIKYPLSNESISLFVDELNESNDFRNIKIEIESIDELRHKNYHGKRVLLRFFDESDAFHLTIDVGVHLPLIVKNATFKYDVAFGYKTKILINPIERMIFEKVSTFAIYGTDNTRDKDYFDLFYLLTTFTYSPIIVSKMMKRELVVKKHYYHSLKEMVNAIKQTLLDKTYQAFLSNSQKNWLNSDFETTNKEVLSFLDKLK